MSAIGQQESIGLPRLPDGPLKVVHGHCRVAAARLLGWTEMDAIIDETPMTPTEVAAMQLASFCRADLNPMERAFAYDRLSREPEMTAAKVASIAGTSESQVSRLRALVGVKPEIQELVATGKLGASLAVLLSLVSPEDRYQEILHCASAGTLTRANLEQAQKLVRGPRRFGRTPRAAMPSRCIVPIGKGCQIVLSATVRSLSEVIGVLTEFLERVRQERGDGLTAFAGVQGSSPGV